MNCSKPELVGSSTVSEKLACFAYCEKPLSDMSVALRDETHALTGASCVAPLQTAQCSVSEEEVSSSSEIKLPKVKLLDSYFVRVSECVGEEPVSTTTSNSAHRKRKHSEEQENQKGDDRESIVMLDDSELVSDQSASSHDQSASSDVSPNGVPQSSKDISVRLNDSGINPRVSAVRRSQSGRTPVRKDNAQTMQQRLEREIARKQRLEERDRKFREAAEKRKLREEERIKKEEEKAKKEEERRRRGLELQEKKQKREQEIEEKRRRKEEVDQQKEAERLKREEAEKRKQLEVQRSQEKLDKQKDLFMKFFSPVRKVKPESTVDTTVSSVRFKKTIHLKEGMKLAPKNRRTPLSSDERFSFDRLMTASNCPPELLYVSLLKQSCHKPGRSARTIDRSDDSADVQVVSNREAHVHNSRKMRVKLLQFHSDYRPPYYGTFRKTSCAVTGRRPWGQDKAILNYDEDSEAEWEEEPDDAEDCRSDEQDEGEDDQEDLDSEGDEEFFVPHGYLSDDEIGSDDDPESLDPEQRRERMKVRDKLWMQEHALKKQERLKPFVIGPVWVEDGWSNLEEQFRLRLMDFEAIALFTDPLPTSYTPECLPNAIGQNEQITKSVQRLPAVASALRRTFPENAVADLAKLLHGNAAAIRFLVPEFQQYWRHKVTDAEHLNPSIGANDPPALITKTLLKHKIREIARYHRGCWRVHADVLAKFEMDPMAKNEWKWITNRPVPAMSSPGSSSVAKVTSSALTTVGVSPEF